MISFQSIALLSPIYVAFVFIMILLKHQKRKNELPVKILFWFFVDVLVFGISICAYQSNDPEILRYFDSFYYLSMLMLHPLLYLYVNTLINNKLNIRTCLFHLSPAILMFVLVGACYLLSDKVNALTYLSQNLHQGSSQSTSGRMLLTLFKSNKIIHGIQAILYFILILRLINKNKNSLSQYFTDSQNLNLNWINILNIFYSIGSLFGIITTILPTRVILSQGLYTENLMLVISCFSLYVGIKGIKQESVAITVEKLDNEIIETNQIQNISSNEHLLEKINLYIIHQKAFINPDLKIWDIVTNTGSNRSYISQIINSTYNMNFSMYVNTFRIEEACRLIEQKKDHSFEAIAFDSGFNSASSFYRTFKQVKGLSPTEYKTKLAIKPITQPVK